jgi:Tfp pilus assembly protein PilW
MSASSTYARLRADTHGFTLIETLVSMIAGVVVTGALSMVFIVALHQTSRLTDSVQATQLGRTAMTHVIDELHSACLSRNYAPVQEKSKTTELIFRNAYSEATIIPNAKEAPIAGTGAYQHKIVWSSAAHTLTDFVYPSESGGEWPKFKFATTAQPASGILFASNVSEAKSGAIFKYYKYGETASSSSTTALSTLVPVTPPPEGFNSAEAASVAAVLVSFTTAPINNHTALSRSAEFSNQVTFAFGTPSSETKIEDQPCA